MIYKNFQGKQLSALGMGCMRLPKSGPKDSDIDIELTKAMFDTAIQSGINYFDTAWGYHNGASETIVGKILQNYPRDSFYLASKFPGYDPSCWGKVESIFEKQLEKCQVDYFDFYLFHNVCEKNIDAYLNNEKYGIYDYLMAQKANGRIKHLGFSAHGSLETMQRFLDAYGKDMEFCQIELNYFDWIFQDAKGKVELLKQWNIPVWVMEPLRGGQLVNLPEDMAAGLKAARPEEDVTAWAFRFIQGISDVVVTLSGMSEFSQLQENITTFEESRPLNEEENALLLDIATKMIQKTSVPCTGCRYCVNHCPQGLDIPLLMHIYNEAKAAGPGDFISSMLLSTLPENQRPGACIGCGACENVCPQQIKIPAIIKALS